MMRYGGTQVCSADVMAMRGAQVLRIGRNGEHGLRGGLEEQAREITRLFRQAVSPIAEGSMNTT